LRKDNLLKILNLIDTINLLSICYSQVFKDKSIYKPYAFPKQIITKSWKPN